MSKLIIVCGLPGSGKTTLAQELSKRLNIVCFHKDAIKEHLYEITEASSLEDSKKIGRQSAKLLLRLAEEQIANDVNVLIEAPFNFAEDYSVFQKWIETYRVTVFSVICAIHDTERQKRFSDRPRHPAHHDAERLRRGEISFGSTEVYDAIPGTQIRVTTDQPVALLADQVIARLEP